VVILPFETLIRPGKILPETTSAICPLTEKSELSEIMKLCVFFETIKIEIMETQLTNSKMISRISCLLYQ
jgi:hypothetical protein